MVLDQDRDYPDLKERYRKAIEKMVAEALPNDEISVSSHVYEKAGSSGDDPGRFRVTFVLHPKGGQAFGFEFALPDWTAADATVRAAERFADRNAILAIAITFIRLPDIQDRMRDFCRFVNEQIGSAWTEERADA